ncbi:hypothetical protein RRG08_030943 [Elysia crispata]|uniref:Uncharacterized protein n=1 Tax=Elysia crispata TaxID=231223 RepID=A0AAE1ACI0_9GAST|nr:hypothetical protein RRG08_030943 [Elysia crispata]
MHEDVQRTFAAGSKPVLAAREGVCDCWGPRGGDWTVLRHEAKKVVVLVPWFLMQSQSTCGSDGRGYINRAGIMSNTWEYI